MKYVYIPAEPGWYAHYSDLIDIPHVGSGDDFSQSSATYFECPVIAWRIDAQADPFSADAVVIVRDDVMLARDHARREHGTKTDRLVQLLTFQRHKSTS